MKHNFLKILVLLFLGLDAQAKDYYIHPITGSDLNAGSSSEKAFQSLSKVNSLDLQPGDRILLAGGETFFGTLDLSQINGTGSEPIVIDSYGLGKALIDAKGELNGILLINSSNLYIKNLRITANGPDDGRNEGEMRVGILIQGKGKGKVANIAMDGLDIFDVFYEKMGVSRSEAEVRSANGTQRYGWGIRLMATDPDSSIEHVSISSSSISNVSHTGIKLTGTQLQNIRQVNITDNQVFKTGGPGIQMSGVKFVYVKGNEVNFSGSNDDTRKWGRGSGLWTWSSSNVLIERNRFLNANGPGDSAGAHIDFNCDNIILQYNFSANNAGGFCEILGNNYNCAYRYNISVNDGHRVKGENGAFQEGKIFWLSGYQGNNKPRKGPVNSYFYNNTIFVKAGQVSKIAIDNRSKGILVVNNIFHLEGPVELVSGDQYKPDESSNDVLERVFFENNLFLNKSNWPENSLIHDSSPIIGNSMFKNPGGLNPEDYIPSNKILVQKGVKIPLLEGDHFGLINGLHLGEDFLGNTIKVKVGLGAIVISENLN